MSLYTKYNQLRKKGEKQLAILIDPDKSKLDNFASILRIANEGWVDMFFVGGSLLFDDQLKSVTQSIKAASDIPVVLFPGNAYQIDDNADAILYLSLISGRNPEFLIGHHVLSAPRLKNSGIEVISTGYMLIDGGRQSSVRYMSNTNPIPRDKMDIAVSTAIAGELLGLKQIYLDAGSGADFPVSEEMIQRVQEHINIPLIVGGGINTGIKAERAIRAGADILVVGNAAEKEPMLVKELYSAVKNASIDYHIKK